MTTLTKQQRIKFGPKVYKENGVQYRITVEVRHDDDCGNGHNTFSITADIKRQAGNRWIEDSCGCLHAEVSRHFPELAPLIKWHLCSTDGPLHYISNSLYWAGHLGYCDGADNDPPNLKNFRSVAIWPDATTDDMAAVTRETLQARFDSLMVEFRKAVESLGFVY